MISHRPIYYILDNANEVQPMDDIIEWAQWMADHADDRVLAQTEISGLTVSTVFTGIGMFAPGGKPLVFETAIFSFEGLELRRYPHTSYTQAMDAHTEAVKQLRQAVNN